jgi:hypothetical protein
MNFKQAHHGQKTGPTLDISFWSQRLADLTTIIQPSNRSPEAKQRQCSSAAGATSSLNAKAPAFTCIYNIAKAAKAIASIVESETY